MKWGIWPDEEAIDVEICRWTLKFRMKPSPLFEVNPVFPFLSCRHYIFNSIFFLHVPWYLVVCTKVILRIPLMYLVFLLFFSLMFCLLGKLLFYILCILILKIRNKNCYSCIMIITIWLVVESILRHISSDWVT